MLELTLRYREPAGAKSASYSVQTLAESWDPAKTAIVICDMWDKHWCAGASRRVAEMAPAMNDTVEAARSAGVLIIHAPSDCLEYYAGTPPRVRAQNAPRAVMPSDTDDWYSLNTSKEPPLPIDDSDGGCDDDPSCPFGSPWTHQIDVIRIADEDALTDSGSEVYSLLENRLIGNVLMMGVHTNMCVLGRSFGIRRLVSMGKRVVLVRDLTDTMYNSRRAPHVPHCKGTDLVVEHIEKHWCPTITSDQLTGKPAFRFAESVGEGS